jgi:hypothetical protein
MQFFLRFDRSFQSSVNIIIAIIRAFDSFILKCHRFNLNRHQRDENYDGKFVVSPDSVWIY